MHLVHNSLIWCVISFFTCHLNVLGLRIFWECCWYVTSYKGKQSIFVVFMSSQNMYMICIVTVDNQLITFVCGYFMHLQYIWLFFNIIPGFSLFFFFFCTLFALKNQMCSQRHLSHVKCFSSYSFWNNIHKFKKFVYLYT